MEERNKLAPPGAGSALSHREVEDTFPQIASFPYPDLLVGLGEERDSEMWGKE